MPLPKLFSGGSADPVLLLIQASATRKAKAELWLKYYEDQQADGTLALIRQRWSRPEDFRITSLNLVKKITNRRASVYRGAPIRHAEGFQQATLDTLYRQMGANAVLKRASRLVKLLKTAMLQVGWTNGRLVLSLIPAHALDVVTGTGPDDLQRVVVTHLDDDKTAVTYSDWTATTYTRRDWRGRPLAVEGNPNGVNPYGRLPFIPLWDRWPDDAFFLPGGDDLIQAQEAINVGLANLWRAVELQAHGQAWASGVPAGDAIRIGPDRAVTLPENGRFGFAAPNAPIGDILSALEFLLRQTAATNDLSSDIFDLATKAESGAAKMAERLDLEEARADDIELWRRYEDQLFDVVRVVANTHAPGLIPDAATIRVDFAELETGQTEGERLDSWQRRIDIGVWSPVDAMLADNPDIGTRDDAMAELTRRREETATLGIGGLSAGPRFSTLTGTAS